MRVLALSCLLLASSTACGDDDRPSEGTPPTLAPLGADDAGDVYRLDDAPAHDGSSVARLVLGPDAIYAAGRPSARIRAIPRSGGATRDLAVIPGGDDAATYIEGMAFHAGHLYWVSQTSKKVDSPAGRTTEWLLGDTDVASGETRAVMTSPPFYRSLVVRASGAICGEVWQKADAPVGVACLETSGAVSSWSETDAKRNLVGLAVRGETLIVATTAAADPAESTVYAFDRELASPRAMASVDGEAVSLASTDTGVRLLVRQDPRRGDEGLTRYGQTLVDVADDAMPIATPTGGRFSAIEGVFGPTTLLRENAPVNPQMGTTGTSGGDASFARFGPSGLTGFRVDAWRGTELVSDGTWAWIGLSSVACVEQGSCYKSSCSCNRYERHDRVERVRVP